MEITHKTTHTNTFTGGMNRDTSENVIKADQYRYAENVTVMADKDSDYAVLQPREHIYRYNNVISPNEQILGQTITKITVNDITEDCLIILTKADNGINRIYRVVGLDTNKLTIKDGKPYIEAEFNITTDCQIIGNVESKEVSKIYLCDGVHQIRSIDVNQDKPMLVEDPSQFDQVPEILISQPKFYGYIGGVLPAGKVQYFIRVFHKGGSASLMSPGSAMIPIAKDPSITAANGLLECQNSQNGVRLTVDVSNIPSYFDNVQVYKATYTSDSSEPVITLVSESSFYGSVITISDSGNSNSNQLSTDEFVSSLVGAVNSPKVMQNFGNYLFLGNITEKKFELDDEESENWYDTRAYRCNSSGKVKLDSITADSLTLDIDAIVSGQVKVPYNHDCINPINAHIGVKESSATDGYFYGKGNGTYFLGGSGPNVSYRFVYGEIAPTNVKSSNGKLNNNVYLYEGSANTTKGIILKYGNGDNSTHAVLANVPRTPNYSDPATCTALTGYQRDEVYAFGVVFYNKQGLKSSVHWIADIKMPSATESYLYDNTLIYPFCPATSSQNYPGSNIDLIGYALGIEFTFKNLPEEVSRYEIVRCDRSAIDRTIVSQGILSNIWGMQKIFDTKSNTWCFPWVWPFTNGVQANLGFYEDSRTDHNTTTSNGKDGTHILNRVGNAFEYISPESCFMDNAADLINSNTIKPIRFIASFNEGNAVGFVLTPNTQKIKVPTNNAQTRVMSYPYAQLNGTSTYIPSFQTPSVSTMKYYFDTAFTKDVSYTIVDSIAGRIDIDGENLNINENPDAYESLTQNLQEWDYINICKYDNFSGDNAWSFAAHGKNNIIKLQDELNPSNANIYKSVGWANGTSNNFGKANTVPVCNVYNKAVVQYLGNTFSARANRTYISTGALSDNETCICYGGDTYLCVFDHQTTSIEGYFAKWGDGDQNRIIACVNSLIPLESTYNIDLRQDDSYSKIITRTKTLQSSCWIANKPRVTDYQVQTTELYKYNSAYSADATLISYVPESLYTYRSNEYTNRVLASEPKVNNEVIDSWTQFKYANYIDIDFNYGQLTNLKSFLSKLYYFTDTSVGVLSVNERSLISDSSGSELVLGTGTILDRYDLAIANNGSCIINDRSIVTSDSSMYWYDPTANELCRYGNGFNIISKNKLVQSDLNILTTEQRQNIVDNKLSVSLFDKKYNEIWMKVYDKPIVFNEQLDVFTSYYTHSFDRSISNVKYPLTISGSNIYYIHNKQDNDRNAKIDRTCKLTYVVNPTFAVTKAFDNVWFTGILSEGIITDINFITKTQESNHLNQLQVENREDTYRFFIPREQSTSEQTIANMAYPARMRGKYLISNYTMDCNDNRLFEIPYINTAYRISAL